MNRFLTRILLLVAGLMLSVIGAATLLALCVYIQVRHFAS